MVTIKKLYELQNKNFKIYSFGRKRNLDIMGHSVLLAGIFFEH